MKIDFHMHGKITSSLPFDKSNLLDEINEAKRLGIDALTLTEHCHAINFYDAYKFLEENYEYINGSYYLVNSVKIFIGVEVSTTLDLDFIFIGDKGSIFEFRKQISNFVNEKGRIEIDELFNHLCDSFIIIFAHPFRKHERLPEINKMIIEKIDAVEINATDLYVQGKNKNYDKIKKLSKEILKPYVCGSDSHYFIQVGSVFNIIESEINSVNELKEKIKNGDTQINISSELEIRVRCQKIIKPILVEKFRIAKR